MSQNGKLRSKVVTYQAVYDSKILGLDSSDAIEHHKTAAVSLSRVGLPNKHVYHDEIAMMLTMGIILHTPDFLDLDEPKKVEEIQSFYASLLWRYYNL